MADEGGKLANAEAKVLEECWSEALWLRAVPLATLSGATVFLAVRRGRLGGVGARYGPWPKVLGTALAAFFAGKVSYLMGRNCQDKFLRQVPDSDISKSIREQRGITQEDRTDIHYDGVGEIGRIDEEAGKKTEEDGHSAGEDSQDVRISTDESEIVISLSNREMQILEDCRKVSVYYFSLPLAILQGALANLGQRKGVLKVSRWTPRPLQRLPKTAFFSAIGYATGQVLYMLSSDCADRFLRQAPHGQMARAIRMMRDGRAPTEEIFDSTSAAATSKNPWPLPPAEEGYSFSTDDELGGYVMPNFSYDPMDIEPATVEELIAQSIPPS